MKKMISITTSCYNEAGNITEFHDRVVAVMAKMPEYDYEIICADNDSTDGTRDEIRQLCKKNTRFKAIFNTRNFGHIRSPWHALLEAKGDAVICMCSDLEDPPELIPDMIKKWEEGYKIALCVRTATEEKGIRPYLRTLYYWLIKKFSDVDQISGFTGFGLYDKITIQEFRKLEDPYPYLRGLISELGWKRAEIPFVKPYRKRGLTKGTMLIYFDMALLGLVNHSKVPLRIATLSGLCVSALSFVTGLFYLFRKFLFWDTFQLGLAPLVTGMFFMFGLLFLFLGLIGEYVGLLVTHVLHRPVVVEEERINFDATMDVCERKDVA